MTNVSSKIFFTSLETECSAAYSARSSKMDCGNNQVNKRKRFWPVFLNDNDRSVTSNGVCRENECRSYGANTRFNVLRGLLTGFAIIFLSFLIFPFYVFASTTDGTIDPAHKYAWGEKIGWINFGCSNCNVRITDSRLTGYAWSENYGWINLNPTNGGVDNDGEGALSGHAWGENLGWVDFGGVQINSSGVFSGIANGPVSGRISFDCSQCQIRTDWRPIDVAPPDPPIPPAPPTPPAPPAPPAIGGGGGGGLPPEAHNLPKEPEGGFGILINNGAVRTDSRRVSLILRGGRDIRTVWISENSQFPEGFQVSYNPSLPQILIPFSLSEGEGLKTVYTKFCTQWDRCSAVVSDDIVYQKPLIERVREILRPLAPEFLRPELPEEISIEELVPKQAPLAFQDKWRLLPSEPIREFVLAPLPQEIGRLAQKFPELGDILGEMGIARTTDIQKLKTAKLTLPGLTERLGLPTWEIQPGEFALPKGVPVAQLSPEMKQEMPAEIVFAKTAGELIDFNIDLAIGEKGEVRQKITTVSGKSLQLIVKPGQPVESIRGYVALKSKKLSQMTNDEFLISNQVSLTNDTTTENLGTGHSDIRNSLGQLEIRPIRNFEIPLESLLGSFFFAVPSFAKTHDSEEIRTRFVLLEFEYTDPDGDGIYTAEIQTPIVEGEYEIITVMDFEDPELGQREIRLITVIDPEGYIYEEDNGKETRIPGAVVSIYWLNPETEQYELWPAKEYLQENPQTTDVRGTYSFLVPEGFYYLRVAAPGYLEYDGEPFQVEEGSGVHINIELKTAYWWLELIDWKTILLIAVIILLLYNFARDRARDRIAK